MARLEGGSINPHLAEGPWGGECSFLRLGCQYASGRGMAVDLVRAHSFFNIAAALGSAEGAQRRAELAADMSADEIRSAQRAARAFLTSRSSTLEGRERRG